MDDIQRRQYTLYTPFIYTLIYTLYTPLDDIRHLRVKVAGAVEEELKVMEPHY